MVDEEKWQNLLSTTKLIVDGMEQDYGAVEKNQKMGGKSI